MTRCEFEEDVTTWDELVEFCNDFGLCSCDDIISYDSVLDDIINEARQNGNLRNVHEMLDSINDFESDYFVRDGYGCYEDLDDYDDFLNYKSDVADEYDRDIGFDDEEDDEDSEDEIELPVFDYEEFDKLLGSNT